MENHGVIYMNLINESEIKYLAGLIDSDGYISYNYVKNKVYMVVGIVQSVGFDRHNYLESLAERFGRIHYRKTTGDDQKSWIIGDNKSLNMLVPRLVKHMIIKAKHLNDMFDTYNNLKGRALEDVEIDNLREWVKQSRLNTGPLKPKNQPSWAWISGYLDGDGCYNYSAKKQVARLEVCAHETDMVGLELLKKSFGGTFSRMGKTNNYRWFLNLGKRDRAFATSFLKKMHAHSRFKKWKIEQILAFHNQAATTKCDTPQGESDSLKL